MNLLESFKPITTLIFDIDGVLTDGGILVFETGEQVRQMSVKDGYALAAGGEKKIQSRRYFRRQWHRCRHAFAKTGHHPCFSQRDR